MIFTIFYFDQLITLFSSILGLFQLENYTIAMTYIKWCLHKVNIGIVQSIKKVSEKEVKKKIKQETEKNKLQQMESGREKKNYVATVLQKVRKRGEDIKKKQQEKTKRERKLKREEDTESGMWGKIMRQWKEKEWIRRRMRGTKVGRICFFYSRLAATVQLHVLGPENSKAVNQTIWGTRKITF